MERDFIHFLFPKWSPAVRDQLCLRPLLLGLCLMGCLISCSKSESKPKNILSKEDLAKVLTVYYLKEARINNLHLNQDSAQILFKYYRKKYEKQSGIPDSLIDASFEYYLSHPFDLSEIYGQIIDTLTLEEHRVVSGGRSNK